MVCDNRLAVFESIKDLLRYLNLFLFLDCFTFLFAGDSHLRNKAYGRIIIYEPSVLIYLKVKYDGVIYSVRRGIGQGSVYSCLLGNIYLHERMNRICPLHSRESLLYEYFLYSIKSLISVCVMRTTSSSFRISNISFEKYNIF